MKDVIVQARVPHAVAMWHEEQAAKQGETLAGRVRRLLYLEITRAEVDCWVEPSSACEPVGVLARGTNPHYRLRLLRELPGGQERVFALFHPEGSPVTREFWQATGYFPTLDDRRFVLDGSHRPWRLMSTFFNRTGGWLELTLRSEEMKILDVRKVNEDKNGDVLIEVWYSDGVRVQGTVRRHGPSGVNYTTNFDRGAGWPMVPPEMILAALTQNHAAFPV